MRTSSRRTVVWTLFLLFVLAGLVKAGEYYPPPESGGGWRAMVARNGTPAAAEKAEILTKTGIDWDKLKLAWDHIDQDGGSFLVIRNGWIAGEWGTASSYYIASCTKSLTSLAMAKIFDMSAAGQLAKTIGPDSFAYKYLPASWGNDVPARKNIRIRHLMTMSSGLEPHDNPVIAGYLNIVLGQPVEDPPATTWAYASVPVDLLSLIVEDVTGKTLKDFFNTEVNARIGVPPVGWDSFSGHSYGSCRASYTARNLARVGYLTLKNGAWDDGGGPNQVVSSDRVSTITQWAPFLNGTIFRQPNNFTNDPNSHKRYGWLWWTNRTNAATYVGSGVPTDAYYMAGFSTQVCFVIPSLDMVVVRLGTAPRPWSDSLVSGMMSRVVDSVVANPDNAPKVERWDTHEIELTAAGSYANPFKDVSVTATFTHTSSGKTITIDGFHDGGSTWRLRFMPTELGDWTYTTSSADSGLNGKTGTIDCIAPAKAYLRGPLAVQGHHFVHADGTAKFLMSTRLTCQFADPALWPPLIQFLKSKRINRVFFTMPGNHFSGSAYKTPYLFGPGTDFDRYNLTAFQSIDAFIDALRKADIIASPYFYYFNDKVQRNMTSAQDQAYIRYGMARFGAYANVMPVLSNEVEQKYTNRGQQYDLNSHTWANNTGSYLKSRAVFGQPVTVHNPMESQGAANPSFYQLLREWPFDAWTDLILKQAQVGSLGSAPTIDPDEPYNSYSPEWNERGYARQNEILIGLRSFGKPIINEEPGYEMGGNYSWNGQTSETLRRTFWTATTAGAYTMWGSAGTYDTGDPLPEMQGSVTPDYMKVLHDAIVTLPYPDMAPDNGVVSPAFVDIDGAEYRTNFALVKSQEAYLVYSLSGGSGSVSLASGRSYEASRIDPRSGAKTDLGYLSGGSIGFSLPANDWVLVYRHDPGAPVVSIASPASGSSFTSTDTVDIVASAADSDGAVAKVEFYTGATLIGTDNNGGDGWSHAWSNPPVGDHDLTARATDNSGITVPSRAMSISVTGAPDTTPPSVPENLVVTAVSHSQIDLTWNA